MTTALLTAAAKAMGYEVLPDFPSFTVRKPDGYPHRWNPLSSSRDAFELLTHLRMHIGAETHAVSAWVPANAHSWASVGIDDDAQAATRRAIVLCAFNMYPKKLEAPLPEDHLYDADPNCEHVTKASAGGGIKCTKCTGWFCF